jgi:multidrug resistance efflux pump
VTDLRAIAAALRCYQLDDLPQENPIRRAHDALLEAERELDRLRAALALHDLAAADRAAGLDYAQAEPVAWRVV